MSTTSDDIDDGFVSPETSPPRPVLVIIPQHPSRWGVDGPERMPIDLRDAQRYGDVTEVLGLTAKPFDPEAMEQLDQFMLESSADDWLLCIGNPTMIAAAAGAFASIHGRLNLLQWQSRARRYEAVEVEYTETGTTLNVATLSRDDPAGEDDDN